MSKELLEKGLINVIRKAMDEHDKYSQDASLAEFASIEASSSGNFINPESGKKYGYKFIVGKPDFWKEESEVE